MDEKRRTVVPSCYIMEGTKKELYTSLKGVFKDELNEQELKVLYLLELDASANHISTEKDRSLWLYEDMTPASLLLGETRYTLEVSASSPEIIKNIFEYAAKYITINASVFDKIKFIYDTLSVLYKHLYRLADYEWCFCFSAVSYMKENEKNTFTVQDVLGIIHQDNENVCTHLDNSNECTWKSKDTCRMDRENARDIAFKLCSENVLQEIAPNTGIYKFVF